MGVARWRGKGGGTAGQKGDELHPGLPADRTPIPFRLGPTLLSRRWDRIELRAFADYWGEKPKFEKVIFRTLLDAQSRLLSLQTGEIDAVADVGGILPEQLPALADLPAISLKRREVATTHYLFFNGRRFPLDRPAPRSWVAGLVDPPAWISALTRGGGRVARDFFTPLAREWAFGSLDPPPGRKPAPDRRSWVILIHNGTLQRWPYLNWLNCCRTVWAGRVSPHVSRCWRRVPIRRP